MMIVIASLAVIFALGPSLLHFCQLYVWYGDYSPNGMSNSLKLPNIWGPRRLGMAIIPALSIIAACTKMTRRVVWAAIGLDLFALVSWVLLYRAWVGPGSVTIWPDDIPKLLDGSVRLWPSTVAGLTGLFGVSTWGEFVDLLALLGLLVALVSLVSRPLPRWLRVCVVLPIICYDFIGWATRMFSERYWGLGDPPQIGLGIIPRASLVEVTQGATLVAILLWLVLIPMASFKRAKEVGSRNGDAARIEN